MNNVISIERRKSFRKIGHLDVVEVWNDDGELEGYALMDRDALALSATLHATRSEAVQAAGTDLYNPNA